VSALPAVPRGWLWTRLGEFAEVKLGKMLSAKARAVGLEQRPYLRNQNVRWGTLDLSDIKTMGFKPGEIMRYSVQPDDLLVCEGGEPARCAVYHGPPAAFMYQKALHRVRPHPGTADPRFVQYSLWHYASNGVVLPRPSETTIQHLPLEEMLALPIPLPPLPEQRRIVEALETQLTRLDVAVATLERVRANLKRYRAAVLLAAVQGRVVDDGAPFPMVQLGSIAESIRNGYSRKPEGEVGVPILRISAVRPLLVRLDDVRFVPSDSALGDAFVENGDALFTRYNGSRDLVGVCGVVRGLRTRMAYPDKLMRVRLDAARVSPEWLEIAANSGTSRAFIESRMRTTAGQSGVSGADLRQLPIPLPSIDVQRRVVEAVAERQSIADAVARQLDAAQGRCTRLRQSVLRLGFEGRLVPQDPQDQPAAVLLDRIRAERAAASSSPKQKFVRSRL